MNTIAAAAPRPGPASGNTTRTSVCAPAETERAGGLFEARLRLHQRGAHADERERHEQDRVGDRPAASRSDTAAAAHAPRATRWPARSRDPACLARETRCARTASRDGSDSAPAGTRAARPAAWSAAAAASPKPSDESVALNSSSGETSAGVTAAAPRLREPVADHAERHAERGDGQRGKARDDEPAPRAEVVAQHRAARAAIDAFIARRAAHAKFEREARRGTSRSAGTRAATRRCRRNWCGIPRRSAW